MKATERSLRSLLASGLLLLSWSPAAHADITSGPPEPCELLQEGAPCRIDGVDPGVCRGKKAWERTCVARSDAGAPLVTLEDAIDAAPIDAGGDSPAAGTDAGDAASPPSGAGVPPAPSAAESPAPPPAARGGCAGCRVGQPASDPRIWVAAALLVIGACARRKR